MATQQFNERSNQRSGKPQQAGEAGVQLRRALSVWGAAFVIASMIGTGIFTVPAEVRAAAGSGVAALGVWMLGGGARAIRRVLLRRIGHANAEGGRRVPVPVERLRTSVGIHRRVDHLLRRFRRADGRLDAQSGRILSRLTPGWNPDAPLISGIDIARRSHRRAIAAAARDSPFNRPSGQMQTTLATMTVGAIVVFIVAGVSTGRGDWGGVTQGSRATGAWWVALIQVSFAYSGWNAAAYLAGEVTEPRRTLPRALIGGTLAVTALYIAINLLYFYALPAESCSARRLPWVERPPSGSSAFRAGIWSARSSQS